MHNMPEDLRVANLSLTDPQCVRAAEACIAFYKAENASQDAIPWDTQFAYGHWVAYYYCSILGALFLWRVVQVFRSRRLIASPRSTRSPEKPTIIAKLQAAGRFIFYRRFARPGGSLTPPSYGTSAFLACTVTFLAVLVFAQKPYYRDHLGYGSPPIAIRSGLMAFACVPILVALAGKVNIVTVLTGISNERLNIMHRWVAWLSFALALIHAIPFFLASYRDPGFGGWDRFNKEWYAAQSGGTEFSGVTTISMLFGLCVLSLPPLRKRFYESFYAVHILLAVTYVSLLFWHSSDKGQSILDSWTYLWATVAAWVISCLARIFWKMQPTHIQNDWGDVSYSVSTILPDDMTRLEVIPNKNFRWTPGQHVFLRFIEFAPFDNHPFTPCSIAGPANGSVGFRSSLPTAHSPLVFLIRSRAGFTRKLLQRARGSRAHVRAKAWVDGPYGGIQSPIELLYDHIVLIAGGSGVTACLPWLLQFANWARQRKAMRTTKLSFIWSIKHAAALSWIENELMFALSHVETCVSFEARFFITSTQQNGSGAAEVVTGKSDEGIAEKDRVNVIAEPVDKYLDRMASLGFINPGRPKLDILMRELTCGGGKTLVFGCGPQALANDLSNAVASAQTQVLCGKSAEVALHLETFGW